MSALNVRQDQPVKTHPETKRAEGPVALRPISADLAAHSIFDVTDIFAYFATQKHPSGIQRVVLHFLHQIFEQTDLHGAVEFIAFDKFAARFMHIPTITMLLAANHLIAHGIDEDLAERFAAAAEGDFSTFDGKPFDWARRKGATVYVPGAAWVCDLAPSLRAAKAEHDVRVVYVIYDLIPVRFPQHLPRFAVASFARFLDPALRLADKAVAISQHVRQDVLDYAADLGVTDLAVDAIRLADFSRPEARSDALSFDLDGGDDGLEGLESFALIVSLIEARKNHIIVLQAWQTLLAEGVEMPDLVLVGRWGWLSEPVRQFLEETSHLDGRVHVVSGISDRRLESLYRKAKFVLFPSLAEGWGLPVTEAIGYGAAVLASNATSIPEAGGGAAIYLDPTDLSAWVDAIRKWSRHPDPRRFIDFTAYKPATWREGLVGLLKGSDGALRQRPERLLTVTPGVIHSFSSGESQDPNNPALREPWLISADGYRCDANDARASDGWLAPEWWGCWTSWPATPSLRLAPVPQGHVLCFDLMVMGAVVGANLSVAVNGETVASIPMEHHGLVLGLRPSSLPAGDGPVTVTFSLAGLDLKEKVREPGGARRLGLGLRSLFAVRSEDALTWGQIALASKNRNTGVLLL